MVRVLVADVGVARERITRVLEQDGRFVVCAAADDAAAAVALALVELPELCLVDAELPGGGLAAAWEITSRLPGSDVVVLTAEARDDDLFEAVRLGAAGYLVKDRSLQWLPVALADVRRGGFAISRGLMRRIVDQLRSGAPRRRSIAGTGAPLTSREWEILDLIGRGLTTRQVAERLTLSPTAVRVHIAAVVRKLGVESRAEAVSVLARRTPASV
jgi:DNA-binding NarL/FixJ family response regulator